MYKQKQVVESYLRQHPEATRKNKHNIIMDILGVNREDLKKFKKIRSLDRTLRSYLPVDKVGEKLEEETRKEFSPLN